MNTHPPADRFEFWVRFVCGAILGLVVGLSILAHGDAADGWWVLPLSAIFLGGVAGWFGDPFWRFLGSFLYPY